jgi:predicted  nucleic acid-binding Zn-ribbon protein
MQRKLSEFMDEEKILRKVKSAHENYNDLRARFNMSLRTISDQIAALHDRLTQIERMVILSNEAAKDQRDNDRISHLEKRVSHMSESTPRIQEMHEILHNHKGAIELLFKQISGQCKGS